MGLNTYRFDFNDEDKEKLVTVFAAATLLLKTFPAGPTEMSHVQIQDFFIEFSNRITIIPKGDENESRQSGIDPN
jgi:hypothetical protein